jgi:hypothetical protein
VDTTIIVAVVVTCAGLSTLLLTRMAQVGSCQHRLLKRILHYRGHNFYEFDRLLRAYRQVPEARMILLFWWPLARFYRGTPLEKLLEEKPVL